MLKRQAFKFELMPNGEQIRRIKQFCGCARFVFNKALDGQKQAYEADNNTTFSYTKIANCRKDFLHKISNEISKNHAMIYMEDLQVSNMSKSAKGTVEQPGQNVAQKSGLNRAILDQGWGEFRRQLEYKSAWRGGFVIAVPPHHTSQTCPCCGHTDKENRPTQEKFECVECGYSENADLVGALNILARGRASSSHQNQAGTQPSCLSRPVRGAQEPTESSLRNAWGW